jgi:hypothetical protein
MKTAGGLISLIMLLIAVFSVATSSPLLASTNEEGQNDPEEEAEKAAEEGKTKVYDDNPDLDGD